LSSALDVNHARRGVTPAFGFRPRLEGCLAGFPPAWNMRRPAHNTELSDCSCLFIIGVCPQTSRCTPPRHLQWGDRSSPGSQPRCFHACAGSQTSWGPRVSGELSTPSVWPSARGTASAPQFLKFRGSIPGLHVPLPTLGTLPHDRPPMARGRYGSPTFTVRLLPSLHPGGLSRRFPTFTADRSTGEAPSFSPAVSPRVRRRLSPWPPDRPCSPATESAEPPLGRALHSGPYPPDWSRFWP